MHGGSLENQEKRYLFYFRDRQTGAKFMDHVLEKGCDGCFTFNIKPYTIAVDANYSESEELRNYFNRISDYQMLEDNPNRKINSVYTKNESGRYTHNSSYTPPENAVDMTGGTGTYNTGSNSSGYIRESDKYKRR